MPDGGYDSLITDISQHERERLEALFRYEILDTESEEAFDRITRLATRVTNTRSAMIAMIDRNRQWAKSTAGATRTEIPRSISFCNHAIAADGPMIVRDAREDPRFRDNPLVTGAPFLRFYMGTPLKTSDGYNIGTLCVFDTTKRELTPDQVAGMQDLACLVISEMELRRIADCDSLTSLSTRRSLLRNGRMALARAARERTQLSCLALDIDHFKAVNDRYGHAVGDLALRYVAMACQNNMRAFDLLGRVGGEEFVAILPGASLADAYLIAERLQQLIADAVITTPAGPIKLTASFGISCFDGQNADLDGILADADEAMYAAKRSGRNRVVISEHVVESYTANLELHCDDRELQNLSRVFARPTETLN